MPRRPASLQTRNLCTLDSPRRGRGEQSRMMRAYPTRRHTMSMARKPSGNGRRLLRSGVTPGRTFDHHAHAANYRMR